jgi:hypothetical protein
LIIAIVTGALVVLAIIVAVVLLIVEPIAFNNKYSEHYMMKPLFLFNGTIALTSILIAILSTMFIQLVIGLLIMVFIGIYVVKIIYVVKRKVPTIRGIIVYNVLSFFPLLFLLITLLFVGQI